MQGLWCLQSPRVPGTAFGVPTQLCDLSKSASSSVKWDNSTVAPCCLQNTCKHTTQSAWHMGQVTCHVSAAVPVSCLCGGPPVPHMLQAPYYTEPLILEMETQKIKCTKSLSLSISCKCHPQPSPQRVNVHLLKLWMVYFLSLPAGPCSLVWRKEERLCLLSPGLSQALVKRFPFWRIPGFRWPDR